MATWLSNAWTDIKAAIDTVWPEATAVFRVTQIEKRNWYNLLTAKSSPLVAPWVVVHMPPIRQEAGWGAGQIVFRAKPTIYYIAKDSGTDIAGAIEAKLVAMIQYIVNSGFSFTLVPDSLALEVSEESPVNMSMLEADMPFTAGSVSFDCLIGFIANT